MSRANVEFILRHEPPLADCEKRWVVNRIVDRGEEQAIIDLLDRHGQSYLHIPFVEAEYARIGWNISCFPDPAFLLSSLDSDPLPDRRLTTEARSRHDKNAYVMNNNGARNAALRAGRSVAKWVLPWDGNCFLTEAGWAEIRERCSGAALLQVFHRADGAHGRERRPAGAWLSAKRFRRAANPVPQRRARGIRPPLCVWPPAEGIAVLAPRGVGPMGPLAD